MPDCRLHYLQPNLNYSSNHTLKLQKNMKEVYIISAVRTPIGSFMGSLSSLTATQLGAAAIKGALEKAGVDASEVQEVFMGNVLSAGLGQAPAKQAALYAGISNTVPCTTVNKVCASGIKSISFAAMSIMSGQNDVIIAGGMESMSNVPHYLTKSRFGYKYGNVTTIDGLAYDGLTDAYDQVAMGVSADATSEKYGFTREAQDEFAIQSYKRSAAATESGVFKEEIVPVEVPQRKGDPLVITEDEEYKRVNFEKVSKLRPAFNKEGTATAANASTLNDGASALLIMSKEKAESLGLKPIAKVVSFADASHEPKWFTTAPGKAAPKALELAGLKKEDIDYFEVNEAFAAVTMAFNKDMGLSEDKVNVHGGAVSLGHPLGCSGARIATTLLNVLKQKEGKYGMAAICNGGGGATAMVFEKM
ncbi:acetyl-CoA acetyltransferase [Microscilla marina ATCC 23134]|uniref:acetyl-CoA C-acetyltransferase n=2 Tax=Microscilla marina TaxID=1027 RepID=A1ZL33_MICM2|nr:acetyl-CoA acetyltransferase [Microscilla marina ATCC 23134]